MRKRLCIPVVTLLLVFLCLILPSKVLAESCNATAPTYSVSKLNGGTISNSSYAGKTKLIIFYRTTCYNSQTSISNVAKADWVSNSDLVVYAVNIESNDTVAMQQSFANTYGNSGKNIQFCYGDSQLIWRFLGAVGHGNSVTLPASFVVDASGQIREYSTGSTSGSVYRDMLANYVSGISMPAKVDVKLAGYYDYDAANKVLKIVNEERAKNGLSPVKMDQRILDAAMQRAAECNVFYGHTRPNGEACFTTPGFDGNYRGENIAVGQESAEAVMTAWMNSPGHRANILTAEFTSMGVGVFYQDDYIYWVQLFSDKTATVPSVSGQKKVTPTVQTKEESLNPYILTEHYAPGGTMQMRTGDTEKLTLVFPNPGFPYDEVRVNPSAITYSSSNSAVVSVDSTGVVKALKGGSAVISMKFAGGERVVKQDVVVTQTFGITTQPTGKSVALGATAKIKVAATGSGLKYTWYYKDANMTSFKKSSQTGATYSMTVSTANSGRKLYCKITDSSGNSVQTNTVTVRSKATITTQPANKAVALGKTASATVKATGQGLKYTWYYKDTNMTSYKKSSQTGATYSMKVDTSNSGRKLYCKVTDKYGQSEQTNTVTLKSKAAITTQPANKSVALGKTASATVKATGQGLKYTWYYKDTNMTSYKKSSQTGATYSMKVDSGNSGRKLYCKITDKYGQSVQTDTVTLRAKVTIITQPTSKTVASGKTVSTAVTATGLGLKYTWYYKDPGMTSFKKSSQTKAAYSGVMSKNLSGRQLYCVVIDKYGYTAKTNTVTLKMK